MSAGTLGVGARRGGGGGASGGFFEERRGAPRILGLAWRRPPVFRYTSHAWLLDLFLNCPRYLGLECPAKPAARELGVTPDYEPACVVCPNASLVAAVEQGIRDDVITWHAFPFNAEPELADAGLLLGGIDSVVSASSESLSVARSAIWLPLTPGAGGSTPSTRASARPTRRSSRSATCPASRAASSR